MNAAILTHSQHSDFRIAMVTMKEKRAERADCRPHLRHRHKKVTTTTPGRGRHISEQRGSEADIVKKREEEEDLCRSAYNGQSSGKPLKCTSHSYKLSPSERLTSTES